MAIKKLQNNYTTPEQSKRLLELGVPAESADCRYENNWSHVETHKPVYTKIMHGHPIHNDDMPCWSVGRLIEILAILYSKPIGWIEWCKELPPIQTILAEIEAGVCQNVLDFSKLED